NQQPANLRSASLNCRPPSDKPRTTAPIQLGPQNARRSTISPASSNNRWRCTRRPNDRMVRRPVPRKHVFHHTPNTAARANEQNYLPPALPAGLAAPALPAAAAGAAAGVAAPPSAAAPSSSSFFFFFFLSVILRTRTFGSPSGESPSFQRSAS